MEQYDVLIIGGGVVGCAIARELSRYQLKLGVLEKNLDVAYETSGRNTGVCHGGFAYDPGTLKAKLCVAGNRKMGELAQELDFGFSRSSEKRDSTNWSLLCRASLQCIPLIQASLTRL